MASYFQYGERATNHFGGLDVAPGCHCRVQRTWCHCCAIIGCHCSVLWLGERVMTNFGELDVVPLLGAIVGDDQLWRSTCCDWWVPLVGGAFFLYINNIKIGFYYLGSILV